MRTDEHEDDSAVDAVVLQDALGQHRAVAGAAPDHPVQADVDAAFVVERVARVRATGVRAGRAPEAAQVVVVVEVVVARRIRTELGIVPFRGQRERRAALPTSDHLGAQQRLLLPARGAFAEVPPVGRDAGVQLPEHDVGTVAAEQHGGRHRRQAARLVGIAEDELAGLDRSLPGVGAGDPAALHRRLADPVLEAEGGAPRRELVAVLAPDHLHPGQLLVGAACPLGHRRQPRGVGRQRRQRHVHVGGSKRLFPIGRAAVADVAQLGRAGRHALPELRREAVQRLLGHAQRLQALVGEGNGDPGAAGGVRSGPAGVDHRVQPPQQLPPGPAVVNAQQQVGADVGRRSWV